MKIAAGRADQFIKAPDPNVSAILVYGPDGGLVRERAQALIRNFAGSLDDPFANVEIGASDLKEDPARLSDEASALSLTGDKRGVYVRDAADAHMAAIEPILDLPPGDTLIVIEAGNLGPRSKLRAGFEKAAGAAAIPCYLDDQRSLGGVVRETLAARNVAVTPDALAYLQAHLGGDRLVTRSELEKLALYKGDSGEVTLEEARLCVGDSTEATLDDLVNAAGTGNSAVAGRLLDRAMQEGANEVGIIRAFIRHFTRLHQARGLMTEGAGADQAMKSLRPPVFFKQTSIFGNQLRRWSAERLGQALSLLADTEGQCKSSGVPSELVCRQAVLRLCALGGARLRRTRQVDGQG